MKRYVLLLLRFQVASILVSLSHVINELIEQEPHSFWTVYCTSRKKRIKESLAVPLLLHMLFNVSVVYISGTLNNFSLKFVQFVAAFFHRTIHRQCENTADFLFSKRRENYSSLSIFSTLKNQKCFGTVIFMPLENIVVPMSKIWVPKSFRFVISMNCSPQALIIIARILHLCFLMHIIPF